MGDSDKPLVDAAKPVFSVNDKVRVTKTGKLATVSRISYGRDGPEYDLDFEAVDHIYYGYFEVWGGLELVEKAPHGN